MKKLNQIYRALRVNRNNAEARKSNKIKIIVGAGTTIQKGWISTDQWNLDLLDSSTFLKFLGDKKADAFLAEHVFEHLSFDASMLALDNIKRYLKIGGNVRIAVPDGFHPDKSYIDQVKPGGCGAGASDHKQLLNYQNLSSLLKENGFKVKLLEYFDENGKFNINEYDNENGYIYRSHINDGRNKIKMLSYTSLIVDANI